MSSKIEVPPCECGSADVSIGYESPQGYWVECGDCGYQTDKSHLQEIVVAWWSKRATPVVERQEPEVMAFLHSGDGYMNERWVDLRRDNTCNPRALILQDHHRAYMGYAQTELAELQATIARLTAENERLKADASPISELEVLRTTCKQLEEFRDKVVYERLSGEPTAWMLDGSVGGSSLDFQRGDLLDIQNRHGGCLVPLYRERLKGGQGEPVMKLEAERIYGGAGEYAVSFVKAGWLDECRKTGGEFLLYASQPAPVSSELVQLLERAKVYARGPFLDEINACLDKVKELNQ